MTPLYCCHQQETFIDPLADARHGANTLYAVPHFISAAAQVLCMVAFLPVLQMRKLRFGQFKYCAPGPMAHGLSLAQMPESTHCLLDITYPSRTQPSCKAEGGREGEPCVRFSSSGDDAIHEIALAEEHGDVESLSRASEIPW